MAGTPDEATIAEFKTGLRGTLIRPSDDGYDAARKIHNAMIDRRPDFIVRCAGVADVIDAVNFARSHGLLVAIRGTGHNIAGTSLCDGGLVIDLSLMKSVRINPVERTARVEGGASWGELNHDLQAFELAATGGFISTTGVSGLTLGGGLGWLVRKHGLALDNLLSADVVTADGQLLIANSSQNEDLFWGLRGGGGGNFGVVTSFEFKVHPAGTVLAGLVLHPISAGKEALQFWREFGPTSPEEFTDGALIFNAPAGMPVPDALHREPIVGIGSVYTGPLDAAESALAPLLRFGPPAADVRQPMPYSAAQTMADFLWPPGSLNYWKSGFLKDLSNEAIDTILAYSAKALSPRTVVVIEHNGHGAISRVGAEETAFGYRDWPYNFLVTSIWTDPAETDANIRWTREFYDAMQPSLADAVYVNYLAEEGEERVRSAYSSATYARLSGLKKKYDPANLFRLNQNIKPAPYTNCP
jgi:FAD/FMN-containing dehydrogenase